MAQTDAYLMVHDSDGSRLNSSVSQYLFYLEGTAFVVRVRHAVRYDSRL